MENQQNWISLGALKGFLDIVTRYNIKGVLKSVSPDRPFSLLHNSVIVAKDNFLSFSHQLRSELSKLSEDKWAAILIDVKHHFNPLIKEYYDWYKANKLDIEKFNDPNPYELMLGIFKSYENEILKYSQEFKLLNLEHKKKAYDTNTEVNKSSKKNNQLFSEHKKRKSYLWSGNPDKELPTLYNLMMTEYKLIAEDTSVQQFNAVFTGQPINEISKINRTKKFNNVLLAYFADRLFQKENPDDYLSIAEKCFNDAKNLNQAHNNYCNNKNRLPKNHQIIDDLLLALKGTL